jgi:hypothetical protein
LGTNIEVRQVVVEPKGEANQALSSSQMSKALQKEVRSQGQEGGTKKEQKI